MRRLSIVLLALAAAGCTKPLPEEGTPVANLYRARCGVCHRAPMPGSLKMATWDMILPRMEEHMARGPMGPLAPEERALILDYLRRNAG